MRFVGQRTTSERLRTKERTGKNNFTRYLFGTCGNFRKLVRNLHIFWENRCTNEDTNADKDDKKEQEGQ